MGLERLILIIKNQGLTVTEELLPDVFLGAIGEDSVKAAQKTVYELRMNGVFAEMDLCGRSVKAQMKYANKIGARFSAVIGENEIAQNKINLKNMENGEQSEVDLTADAIMKFIQEGI